MERWTRRLTQDRVWGRSCGMYEGADVRCGDTRAIKGKTDIFHLSKRKTAAVFCKNGETAKRASWWGKSGICLSTCRLWDATGRTPTWRKLAGSLDTQEARRKTLPKAVCPDENILCLVQSTSRLASPRLREVNNLLLHRFEDAVSLEFHKRKQNIPCALRRRHKQHIPMGRGRGSTVCAYV